MHFFFVLLVCLFVEKIQHRRHCQDKIVTNVHVFDVVSYRDSCSRLRYFRSMDLQLKSYIPGCNSSFDPLVALKPLTIRLDVKT